MVLFECSKSIKKEDVCYNLGHSIKETHFFHALSLMVRESVGIKVECG